MWDKLAERIAKRITSEVAYSQLHGFSGKLSNLELETISKDEIKKFVDECVVQCYFKCDEEIAKKAKGSGS